MTVFALQVPSGGVRLVGLSHTARNNAMVWGLSCQLYKLWCCPVCFAKLPQWDQTVTWRKKATAMRPKDLKAICRWNKWGRAQEAQTCWIIQSSQVGWVKLTTSLQSNQSKALQLSCDESDCQWRQLVLMSNRIFIYTIIKLLSSCSSSSILIQIYTPDIANMILSYSWGGWEYVLKTRGLPPQQSPPCAQGHSMSSRFWECLDLSMCIWRHQ